MLPIPFVNQSTTTTRENMSNGQNIVKISFASDQLDVLLSQPQNGPIIKKWVFENEVTRITRGLKRHEFSVTWITKSIF